MSLKSWLTSAYVRNYPRTPAAGGSVKLESALNEKSAFQLVLRNEGDGEPIDVEAGVADGGPFNVQIRRVGYVPVAHFNTPVEGLQDCEGLDYLPGLAPDPLFDETSIKLPARETHSFWITLHPKRTIKPGRHKVAIFLKAGGKVFRTHAVAVKVHDVKLRPREDFAITHWFYTDAIIDWYKTDGYDERFWKLLPIYLKNLVGHGQDTLLTPLFTPPLDGVKTPCQLLKVGKVGPHKYRFDFTDVKRFIAIARQCGIRHFEWCHLATQWGARFAINVYEGQGRDRKLLWKPQTKATSNTYKQFLSQLMPRLHDCMKSEGVLNSSFFHLSDEPHGKDQLASYLALRKYLAGIAPWMKIMDAMSDIDFAAAGAVDTPVAGEGVAKEFLASGCPCWVYYCCGPRGKYLNHLLDTPLAKIAMHGVLLYRFPFKGFLHWGYNYWYRRGVNELIDPFTVSDAGFWPVWPYGDTFLVYPGPEGPIDSIRWEVMGMAFGDYQLLQTLGVDRDDELLGEIKDFAEFPKSPEWRMNLRRELFARR
jgi:hypothetical protein